MAYIALIRHGETYWNAERRTQGHSHNPLNELGLQQAEKVADRLAATPWKWDVLLSSDLMRARQTTEIIARRLQLEIVEWDVRLREVDRGQISGTTEAERIERWGAGWRQLDLGIETSEKLRLRGSACLEDIAREYKGKRVLIVSHGIILSNVLAHLVPDLDSSSNLHNTSMTILTKADADQPWQCELYNCAKHLESSSVPK
ncbi:histidine phosphatase family protein [Paenibacillus koleovorans]|uniref:histidine phosphatase family protein n=1 Tax=Paenibacillus koleovorans TaxID=121608 RepID=UPI000FD8C91D|nr:histidine phosphatase family protein [Paenibacillus koleovorans]